MMLPAGRVMAIGAVLDRAWLETAVWTIATALVGRALRRRLGRSARSRLYRVFRVADVAVLLLGLAGVLLWRHLPDE